MGQEPIVIREGFPLSNTALASNVASNEARKKEEQKDDLAGRAVFPSEVTTQHMTANGATIYGDMRGGSLWLNQGGVTITSDPAAGGSPGTGLVLQAGVMQLIKDSVAVVSLDGTTGDASFTGVLTSSTLNSVTINSGSINVGASGVSIVGGAGTGISIASNAITCVVGGDIKFSLSGDTGAAYFKGEVTASKFVLTANDENSVNLTQGTNYLGTSVIIGPAGSGRTVNDLSRHYPPSSYAPTSGVLTGDTYYDTDDKMLYRYNGSTWVEVASVLHTYYQSTAPISGMVRGDLWVDSDDLKSHRYDGSNWTAQITGTVNATFAQTSAPAALAPGDLWVDTDDGNKMYRATTTGTGGWVAVLDAITDGNGVTTNTGNQITTIDCDGITIRSTASNALCTINSSGISIQSATSGNRSVITNGSLTIYKTGTTVSVSITASNGIGIYNHTSDDTPGNDERLSFFNNAGTECLKIWAPYTGSYAFIKTGSNVMLSITADSDHDTVIQMTPCNNTAWGNGFRTEFLVKAENCYFRNDAGDGGATIQGVHTAYNGTYKADTSFSFYAAASSGGAVTTKHTVTFKDGLVSSWAAV